MHKINEKGNILQLLQQGNKQSTTYATNIVLKVKPALQNI